MKDFTLSSSMTQSFASVTSLPRDISCEDLDSSSADKTVTEEYIYEVSFIICTSFDMKKIVSAAGPITLYLSKIWQILLRFFKVRRDRSANWKPSTTFKSSGSASFI